MKQCSKHQGTSPTILDLAPGEWGIVSKITVSNDVRQRLMDLGLIEGARVEMVRAAPMGDPVQIRVLSTLLAVRKSEARNIFINRFGVATHGRKANRHRIGRKPKFRKDKSL